MTTTPVAYQVLVQGSTDVIMRYLPSDTSISEMRRHKGRQRLGDHGGPGAGPGL
jgi:hypothetical protein